MQSAQLARPEAWYGYDSAKAQYALTDPITGDPINPDVIPSYIRNEPELRAGADYLGRGLVALNVAYLSHETAEGFGDPAEAWFERQVQAADYYGYEDINYNPHTETEQLTTAKAALLGLRLLGAPDTYDGFMQYSQKLFESQSTKPGASPSFELRKMRAIGLGDTHSFAADVSEASTRSERQIMRAFRSLSTIDNAADRGAAFVGLTNAREWVMPVKLGARVMRAEQRRRPRPLDVLMTVGSLHRDVSRKAMLLGSKVNETVITTEQLEAVKHYVPLGGIASEGVLSPLHAANFGQVADKLQETLARRAMSTR